MSDQERAFQLAIDEIRQLRRSNEVLSARVETVELMSHFLFAQPPHGRGEAVSEDAVWLLQRELDKLHKQQAEKKSAARGPATVAELDALLNSEDETPVTINRDGSVTAASGGLAGGQITGDPNVVRRGNR